MGKKRDVFTLIILILIFISINYNYFDNKLTSFLNEGGGRQTVSVLRIVDGDTIELQNKEKVRLLGINTPEKGDLYYGEAKTFLGELILNKTVELEFGKDKYDRYNRTLAYIFLSNESINKKLVEGGYANIYFPSGKDKYYYEFKRAWEDCIVSNVNLCEKSQDKCANCIELTKLDYQTQEVILYNKCNFDCNLNNWTIKDEGRKSFVFYGFVLKSNNKIIVKVDEGVSNSEILYWKNQDYVWTKTGDSLFLKDFEEKLILYNSY